MNSTSGLSERPEWWPEHLRNPPENACFPRVETPHHSLAVGSYGGLVVAHALTYGVVMRWWQEYVVWRLLEHGEDGNLLWPEAAVSVARQVGKGYGGIRPMGEWRSSAAATEMFGEPQTVLHLAHQVNTVMEIATPALARAREAGDRVRLTNGEQQILRDFDGATRWLMRSMTGAYGFSVSQAMVDEVWAVPPRAIDSMVVPTMVERANPQLIMWSTANSRPTATYPRFRATAGEDEGRLVVEWSPPSNADIHDRRVWRMASPHWSPQRERMMARQLDSSNLADFKANWLNIWPDIAEMGPDMAMDGWGLLGVTPQDDPGRGGLVLIDEAMDASCVGMLVCIDDDFWYEEFSSLEETIRRANAGHTVVLGMSLVDVAAKAGLRGRPLRYGAKETRMFTPLMMQAVRDGKIRHNYHERGMKQAAAAVVVETEHGQSLSARKSGEHILLPKLVAWALGARRSISAERPRIW